MNKTKNNITKKIEKFRAEQIGKRTIGLKEVMQYYSEISEGNYKTTGDYNFINFCNSKTDDSK